MKVSNKFAMDMFLQLALFSHSDSVLSPAFDGHGVMQLLYDKLITRKQKRRKRKKINK